jgi:hypothetical protein
MEGFTLLLAAHLLADFPLQNDWLIARKKRPPFLVGHALVVGATAALLLGGTPWLLLALLVFTHLLMDAIKVYLLKDTLPYFLLDQGVHIAVIAGLAIAFPEAWQSGWWALLSDREVATAMALVSLAAGVMATLKPGAIIIQKATADFADQIREDPHTPHIEGLAEGGLYIGYLERVLVLMLIAAGQPAGVGFLITAKSILRFGDVKESTQRKMTEYIIIGTFMSFAWGLLVALLTRLALVYWAGDALPTFG